MNGSLIVLLLIKNHYFFWQILIISLIVALGCFLMTPIKAVWLLIVIWANFLINYKNIGFLIGYLKKYYNLCTKLNVCRKYQGKTPSINLELGSNKIRINQYNMRLKCIVSSGTSTYLIMFLSIINNIFL